MVESAEDRNGLPALHIKIDRLSDALNERLDRLSVSVDGRFEQVDQRFAQVDERFEHLSASVDAGFAQVDTALVEQRTYTEFAYDALRSEMHAGFVRIERKLDHLIDLWFRRMPPDRSNSPR